MMPLCLYAQDFKIPSAEVASFNCKNASNMVEKWICEKNSYLLKRLDNILSNEYKFFTHIIGDNKNIKNDQISWLKKRNTCSTKKCVQNSYQERIVQIREMLLNIFKNKQENCNADVYSAIFQKASTFGEPHEVAKTIFIDGAYSEEYIIDLDMNNIADPSLSMIEEHCRATNCTRTKHIVIKVDSCFTTIDASLLRSQVVSPNNLKGKVLIEYRKGNYVDGIGILTSYNAAGCAGGTGYQSFEALDKKTLKFITFASVDYDCGEDG